MRRGEVTAFLSLIFVLFISFITAMLEGTVLQSSKSQKRLDTDGAMFSVFGEYDRDLLENYDILALDSSYGTGTAKEENLTDRMRYYGVENMEHSVVGIQYLTDRHGRAFREQAVAYMKDVYGLSIIQDLTGKTGLWEKQELQSEEIGRQETENNLELESVLEESEEGLAKEGNPILHMEEIKKSGILKLVLPKDFGLSQKEIRQTSQPSYRTLQSGRGSFYMRQGMKGVPESLLFHEYILKKFHKAVPGEKESKPHDAGEGERGGKSLDYEVEYILSEKSSDVKNLEATVNKLLTIRFGINMIHLQTDAAKQAEAQALAITLSALVSLPIVSELVKQALLAAWAFGESIMDMRALLAGKRNALVKNSSNWQLSLSGLTTLGAEDDAQEGGDVEGGVTYTDYLRMLLFLKDEDILTMKALDRVEQNMRMEYNNSSFCIDFCVVKLRVKNKATIRDGLSYEFPSYFGYKL